MLLNEYLTFASSIGWLVASTLAAVVPSLPGGFGRRHAGWLFAFCVTRILEDLVALMLFEAGSGSAAALAEHAWHPFAAIASGMVLWEFTRRLWNDQGRRRIPAATHLIAAECIALVGAVTLALGDAARPAWFAPVTLAAALLPGVLGFASALLLCKCLDREADVACRTALRIAALGLGAFAAFSEIPGLPAGEAVPPWVAVAGLGLACFALPAARTRFTLLCALGLFLAVVAGPYATRMYVEARAEEQCERLRTQAGAAASRLQGAPAAALESAQPGVAAGLQVQQQFQRIRSGDTLVRDVAIWKIRGDQMRVLAFNAGAPGEFVDPRTATPAERSGFALVRSFVLPPAGTGAADGLVHVHVPLRAAAFDSPAAWLQLEYPDALWALQRQHARRGGLALCGAIAAFCAIGFVLALRHTLENAQQLAIERAQSADKAKTEFLAFLSHEMRTPLQTILGRAELLQAGATATDGARRHGAAIETQSLLLLRLVTDLLDLGTLEAGKFQLRPHPFSLRRAIAAIEDTIRAPAAAKQLALEIAIASTVPDHLIGDETRLRQVLGNVLGNAVKYTARGYVRFTVEREPGEENSAHLVFRVADTGPGFPPDKIPQLFTLFTRLDSGDTFTREGTGVGLALVRRLCELMGGNVTAANRPEGGAEFTVRFAFPVDARAEETEAALPTDECENPNGLRVLVAEDNTAAREFLVEALQSLGHRAESTADGTTALAMATTRAFDVVLLDVNLPGRDGVSIAAALASQPDCPRLIGCSAEAFAHTREAALAAGMDTFLEKPVGIAALAAALQPAAPAPASANLFERLRAPELVAQARTRLSADLPGAIESLRASHDAGDVAAVRRAAHFLQSNALLANESAVAELCRRLEHEAAADAGEAIAGILAELDRHASAANEVAPGTRAAQRLRENEPG